MANIRQKAIITLKEPKPYCGKCECSACKRQRKEMEGNPPKPYLDRVKETLIITGKVKLGGMGIFELRDVKARESHNVFNGARITIPEHKKIVFRPTKKLRDLIQTY